jgi:hypothetical protein
MAQTFGTFWIFYSKGIKPKSYADQTENFEIYGGPPIISSSILFNFKHNIKTTTHCHYSFKTIALLSLCWLSLYVFIFFTLTYPVHQSLQEIVKKTIGFYATNIIALLIGQILP